MIKVTHNFVSMTPDTRSQGFSGQRGSLEDGVRLGRKAKAHCVALAYHVRHEGTPNPWCMLTFTIPGDQVHHDTHYSKALSRQLDWMRLTFGSPDYYLWVAERQERGAIHFHMLYSGSLVRSLQDSYLSKDRTFFAETIKRISLKWSSNFVDDPLANGVDIQFPRETVEAFLFYVTKYFQKGTDIFHCRPFGASRTVVEISRNSTVTMTNEQFWSVLEMVDIHPEDLETMWYNDFCSKLKAPDDFEGNDFLVLILEGLAQVLSPTGQKYLRHEIPDFPIQEKSICPPVDDLPLSGITPPEKNSGPYGASQLSLW